MTERDLTLGAPGLDCYAYQATVYCVDCGRARIHDICQSPEALTALAADDTLWLYDSENVPQPGFFTESDTAQYCDDCGEYLYGPMDETEAPE